MTEENRETKRSYLVKQEGVTFTYDPYAGYSPATSTSSTVNSPLPGQPPLPPMPPPPPGALPPPPHVGVYDKPHVFVAPQMNPIQTWTHAPPPWQWLAQQQANVLSSQAVRDIATNFQRELPIRGGNFIKRERFNGSNINANGHVGQNNRNNIYNQRNNFHRNKNNRRTQRFESPQGKVDQQQTFFDGAHVGSINIPNLMNHLKTGLPSHRMEDAEIKSISVC